MREVWQTVRTAQLGELSDAMLTRGQALDHIREKQFDLCVIGGGATGAACALDAQLRGIRTVLLEAGDFGGATSSASTKIVHGGIRYLEEAIRRADLKEYRVLTRALRERARMLHNAPHLARKLEFVVPCYRWRDIAYLEIGLKIYDRLAGSGRLAPSKFLSKQETLNRLPALKRQGLLGSVVYSDGQFDDTRYNLALVQTFCTVGGQAANYARVSDFQRDLHNKLNGVMVRDELSKNTFTVAVKAIVNATGTSSDTLRRMANPALSDRMRPSKGAHILLPLGPFSSDNALLIPKTEDGRVLFAIPWNQRLLVGTTDEEIAPDAELAATREDVDFLLRHLNRYLAAPSNPEQVVSAFAGARPLVASNSKTATKDLARDDVIEVDASTALISIMGGKWTTHRAMAEDTIHRVQEALNLPPTDSQTSDYVLSGGRGFTETYWEKLCSDHVIAEATARHLSTKFGTTADDILAMANRHPALAQPIIPGFPAIQAEVVYAARQEMAMTLEDVLARRIGLQFFSWGDAKQAAPVVAALLGQELGWSSAEQQAAIATYIGKIERLIKTAGLRAET